MREPRGSQNTREPRGSQNTRKPHGLLNTHNPHGSQHAHKPRGSQNTRKPRGSLGAVSAGRNLYKKHKPLLALLLCRGGPGSIHGDRTIFSHFFEGESDTAFSTLYSVPLTSNNGRSTFE